MTSNTENTEEIESSENTQLQNNAPDVKNTSNSEFDTLKDMLANITHGDKKYDKNTILKMRAEYLAQIEEKSEADGKYIHFIEFIMANEKYAFETDYVSEVYQLKNLRKIPCTPDHILGVINFQGRIVPVIDLKVILNLTSEGNNTQPYVIMLRNDQMEFGILADSLIGNNSVSVSEMQTSLSTLSEAQASYMTGITHENTVILNGLKILTSTNLIVNDKF
ncbi:MAG: chemotaxis protein CheW [bacterium]|nr:chemotaxis protein CheW [bacterium]